MKCRACWQNAIRTVKQLILHPCYTVGYGSKDHYNFPYYGAVAAMYGDGHSGAPG
jgi:hypothetical protein